MELQQLVQTGRIFRPSIGIKNKNSVCKIIVHRLKHKASHRRNADTAREENGWNVYIVMERERAMRRAQGDAPCQAPLFSRETSGS